MRFAEITTMVTATALLGCSTDNPLALDEEADLHRGRRSGVIHFQATQTATPGDASDVVCPEGEVAGKNLVVGESTPLGPYTGETDGCINQATGVWSRISGTVVFTDGDGLRTEMDPDNPGRFVSIDFTTGEFETTGALLFVGGTGKFKRASGYTVFRSAGNLFVPGSAVTTNEGFIYLPRRRPKHRRRGWDRHDKH